MKAPIIMSAFGTTSKAMTTYNYLDDCIRNRFPDAEIIWAYSSKRIARALNDREKSTVMHPEQVLQQLVTQGRNQAIVQSLHLFPGTEFHGLLQSTAKSPLKCAIGRPLLTTPQDYEQLSEILEPIISLQPNKAILVLGHGTDHPIWTAYYTLEKILRKKFGTRIFVGVVEKYPDTSHLVDEIADSGFSEACIMPLFLVAGMHYRRDIISDNPTSWQSRLESRNIKVESIDYGLGMYPGFEKIIIRHIIEAQKTLGDTVRCENQRE